MKLAERRDQDCTKTWSRWQAASVFQVEMEARASSAQLYPVLRAHLGLDAFVEKRSEQDARERASEGQAGDIEGRCPRSEDPKGTGNVCAGIGPG